MDKSINVGSSFSGAQIGSGDLISRSGSGVQILIRGLDLGSGVQIRIRIWIRGSDPDPWIRSGIRGSDPDPGFD